MEFNTTQKTLFGHTNATGSFFGESLNFTDGEPSDGGGVFNPDTGGWEYPEDSARFGWCCCAEPSSSESGGPRCIPCEHCHSLNEGDRMAIHKSKAICEAFGSIFQDTKISDGSIVPQGTRCGGDGENPFVPVEASATPGDTTGGTTGWSGGGLGVRGGSDFIPGTPHDIGDSRVTPGGRSYGGLPHGRMGLGSHSTSEDPNNLYKCFYNSKDDDIGTCVVCTDAEIQQADSPPNGLQDAFGNYIQCVSLEQCRSWCDQHGPPGYRCILKNMWVMDTMEVEETPFCEQVYGTDIEYGTLSQCQQNCTGHDALQDRGWNCVVQPSVFSTWNKNATPEYECVPSDGPGRYESEEECRQSCWNGAPPVI